MEILKEKKLNYFSCKNEINWKALLDAFLIGDIYIPMRQDSNNNEFDEFIDLKSDQHALILKLEDKKAGLPIFSSEPEIPKEWNNKYIIRKAPAITAYIAMKIAKNITGNETVILLDYLSDQVIISEEDIFARLSPYYEIKYKRLLTDPSKIKI